MPSVKWRGDRVYVVVWPEHRIVKAGETSQQRWRAFMHRGARLHQLTLFGSLRDSLAYEEALHGYLRSVAPFAFATKQESRPLFGNLGGHCESYRIPDWDCLSHLPEPAQDTAIADPNYLYFSRPVGGVI